MRCQSCGENPATIHTVLIAGGMTRELFLCGECAKKRGFSINKVPLLINFITAKPDAQSCPGETCPRCGSSLASLREQGVLGCSSCYQALAAELSPLIRRSQGGRLRHVGRRPAQPAAAAAQAGAPTPAQPAQQPTDTPDTLEALEQQLRQAVAGEEYERAAHLRDEIRARRDKGGEGA